MLEEARDRVLTRMQDKTTAEWISLFSELGNIAAHGFQTTQQAMDDPDLRDNEMVVEVLDPKLGVVVKDDISIMESVLGQVVVEADEDSGRSEQLGLLARLEHTPGTVGGAAPAVGQHTIEVLAEERTRWRGSELNQDDTSPPLSGVTVLEFASIHRGPARCLAARRPWCAGDQGGADRGRPLPSTWRRRRRDPRQRRQGEHLDRPQERERPGDPGRAP